ncbi:MAG: hypothetical protein ABJA82_09890 [Myxococcales bacterium]
MLADFSLATFGPLVGSVFEVTVPMEIDGRGVVEIELVTARGLGTDTHEADQRSFVLELRGGPGTSFVPQGMFTFAHPHLGAFEMFVSPTARSATGFTTEAVFNRLPAP